LGALPPIELPSQYTLSNKFRRNKENIFIVHGQDEEPKFMLRDLLYGLGLNPIILHDEPNKGRTIIEKFEDHAGIANYAFILLTQDDVGRANVAHTHLNYRARQNVIFELGFFVAKLGRNRVCCIYKKDLELPSDIGGLVYLSYVRSIQECNKGILRELNNAGYNINQ
jgi:predicted nucleotide-binding protein